ncbi:MAG TPA: hypothetical protein VG537_04950 [Candidatus Kapabacteria bacterium]|nr:hypothetical protein [Candidatus Kapabacteria bacterium]
MKPRTNKLDVGVGPEFMNVAGIVAAGFSLRGDKPGIFPATPPRSLKAAATIMSPVTG